MSRSYFGTMIAVEGWAVHMQQLLVTEGFSDEGAERIFFAWSAALMPLAWMLAQILRAKRMLLQGSRT